jgi:FkbM family methyltransferase
MSTTYSQIGQDTQVAAFYKQKKGGFFIEIGAYDGIKLSNTYLLETRYGWTGICIEPNPYVFDRLKANRQASVCIPRAAHGTSDLQMKFDIAKHNDMLSGLSESINTHQAIVNANKETIAVPTVSLASLDSLPHFIEYLSIAAAGAEYTILQSINFKKNAFGLIHVVHNYKEPIRSQIRTFLTANGYTYSHEIRWVDCYRYSGMSVYIHIENVCPSLFKLLNRMHKSTRCSHRLDNRYNYDPAWFNVCISSEPEELVNEYDMHILPFKSVHPKAVYYPFLYMALAEMRCLTFPAVEKTEFCAFMYFRSYSHRDALFHRLNAVKRVDALGRACNNTPMEDTRHVFRSDDSFYDIAVRIYSKYKFVLAVENAWTAGYFTEKLLLPLFAGSIPIYWGHPAAFDYINKRRVLYLPDFATDAALFERLDELMADTEKYNAIVAEPWYTAKGVPEQVDADWLHEIRSYY